MTVKMTSATIHPATVLSGEEFRCFVCDIVVSGRYYTLATCRTQSTKIRLIEKLGQLVGERYTKHVLNFVFPHLHCLNIAIICSIYVYYIIFNYHLTSKKGWFSGLNGP